MTTYVLKRTGSTGGGFVAKSGHRGSYTNDLRYAEKFSSREAAVAQSCAENESPVPLESILDEYRS